MRKVSFLVLALFLSACKVQDPKQDMDSSTLEDLAWGSNVTPLIDGITNQQSTHKDPNDIPWIEHFAECGKCPVINFNPPISENQLRKLGYYRPDKTSTQYTVELIKGYDLVGNNVGEIHQ